jgi:hypothetical protein
MEVLRPSSETVVKPERKPGIFFHDVWNEYSLIFFTSKYVRTGFIGAAIVVLSDGLRATAGSQHCSNN